MNKTNSYQKTNRNVIREKFRGKNENEPSNPSLHTFTFQDFMATNNQLQSENIN